MWLTICKQRITTWPNKIRIWNRDWSNWIHKLTEYQSYKISWPYYFMRLRDWMATLRLKLKNYLHYKIKIELFSRKFKSIKEGVNKFRTLFIDNWRTSHQSSNKELTACLKKINNSGDNIGIYQIILGKYLNIKIPLL